MSRPHDARSPRSGDSAVIVLAGSVVSRKVIFDKKGNRWRRELEDFVGAAELILSARATGSTSRSCEDAVVVASGRARARGAGDQGALRPSVHARSSGLDARPQAAPRSRFDGASLATSSLRLAVALGGASGRLRGAALVRNATRDVQHALAQHARAAESGDIWTRCAAFGGGRVRLTCAGAQPGAPRRSRPGRPGGFPPGRSPAGGSRPARLRPRLTALPPA